MPSRCTPTRSSRCWNGSRATVPGAARKSDKAWLAVGTGLLAPASPRYVSAVTSAEADTLALIAATTCAAVLASAPLPLVARPTETRFPMTETESGAFGAPGSSRRAETVLPPSSPSAFEVRITARPPSAVVRLPVSPA